MSDKPLIKHLVLLIKPASGRCNMRCKYCFYADEAENRSFKDCGLMSRETADNIIDKALDRAENVTFSFQGGEPTVRGIDFFRGFVEYANEKGGKRVGFAIQTNGFAINREWVSLFKDNSFLVGLSLDGNKDIQDKYRRTVSGDGSFRKVFSTAQLFRSSGVDFNILITVNRDVADNIEDIYRFFVRNGFRYQQYIPCLDPIGEDRGSLDYSLTPEIYGEFLIKLFRLYYRDWQNGRYVSVRYFDNIVNALSGRYPEQCGMLGFCPSNYVFEADGSVYPCDFYVLDGYCLGNINTDSFDSMDEKRVAIAFTGKSRVHDEECRSCRYFPICRGGCRRDREDFNTGELGRSYLCQSYKAFFDNCLDELLIMARSEIAARNHFLSS